MKKFTLLNAIMLVIFVMFISMPAFAFMDTDVDIKNSKIQGAIGNGNIGLQTNGAIHHNTINSGTIVKKGAVQVKNTNVNLNANINKNVNKNTNVNVNKNTNKQGQIQGQKQQQGQIQGQAIIGSGNSEQSQTAHNEGVEQTTVVEGDTLTIEGDTFIEAETKREHHTGTTVTFASLGTYSESKYAGSNFQSAKILTMFKDTFSYEAALEVYGKPFGKGLCETVGKSYNGRHEDAPSAEIKVFTMDDKIDPSTIEAIGFLTVIGREGQDATSFIVMQKCILSACIMQGDAIVVTKEGAETITKSSGWGIGFNTSGSVINDMGNRGRSGAASGGTGWSTGKGSLEILPWMTVQVLKFK
jgi:hypothetical protein